MYTEQVQHIEELQNLGVRLGEILSRNHFFETALGSPLIRISATKLIGALQQIDVNANAEKLQRAISITLRLEDLLKSASFGATKGAETDLNRCVSLVEDARAACQLALE